MGEAATRATAVAGRGEEVKKNLKKLFDGGDVGARQGGGGGRGEEEEEKIAISPFFDASGNKNIGATITIRQEIRCLPYAGFFSQFFFADHGK